MRPPQVVVGWSELRPRAVQLLDWEDLTCHSKQVPKIKIKNEGKSIPCRMYSFGANMGHGLVLLGNWTETSVLDVAPV